MQSSLDSLHNSSIVRSPNGEMLSGFARDFLRASIKTTIKFPQTQAVIKIAIAKVLLQASIEKRDSQIVDIYKDLELGQNRYIDLNAISRFVSQHYEKLGLKIPPIPTEKYCSLFLFEIKEGLNEIGAIGRMYFKDENSGHCARLITSSRPEPKMETEQLPPPFQIEEKIALLKEINQSLKEKLYKIFDLALDQITKDPRGKSLLNSLVTGLKTKPKDKWFFEVIFPYGSFYTKFADGVVHTLAKTLCQDPCDLREESFAALHSGT